MTNREFFIQCVTHDIPANARVVKALPQDKLSYRPHPNSRSAHELAMMVGFLPQMMVDLVDKGKLAEPEGSALPPLSAIVQASETGAETLAKRLQSVDEKSWESRN